MTPTTDHPCHDCGHRMTARNWSSETGDQIAHICNHPTGAKEIKPSCEWRTDGEKMRALSNRVFG